MAISKQRRKWQRSTPEFQCMECGKTFAKLVRVCPKCRSVDIDEFVPKWLKDALAEEQFLDTLT